MRGLSLLASRGSTQEPSKERNELDLFRANPLRKCPMEARALAAGTNAGCLRYGRSVAPPLTCGGRECRRNSHRSGGKGSHAD